MIEVMGILKIILFNLILRVMQLHCLVNVLRHDHALRLRDRLITHQPENNNANKSDNSYCYLLLLQRQY
jgi:hypothetical protein